MAQTLARHLAETHLPGGVDAFIAGQRAKGDSWFEVSLAIYDATNRLVRVTPETVRNWTLKGEVA
jgi:hypothetical protein